MSKRERRVSTRVNGWELVLLERSGLSNGEIVRYGIRKYFEEHPIGNEHSLLTEISFLQDKNKEYELKIEANELLIQEKIDELNMIRSEYEKVIYDRLIEGLHNLLLDFMDDEKYSWEIRSDLTNFYNLRRDSISNLAARYHKTYKEAIGLFEDYLDSFGNDDVSLLDKDKNEVRTD